MENIKNPIVIENFFKTTKLFSTSSVHIQYIFISVSHIHLYCLLTFWMQILLPASVIISQHPLSFENTIKRCLNKTKIIFVTINYKLSEKYLPFWLRNIVWYCDGTVTIALLKYSTPELQSAKHQWMSWWVALYLSLSP